MTAMTTALASERRRVIETGRETAKRHSQNYVTERERRLARSILERQTNGFLVTPAQFDYVANIQAVLRRRGEVL